MTNILPSIALVCTAYGLYAFYLVGLPLLSNVKEGTTLNKATNSIKLCSGNWAGILVSMQVSHRDEGVVGIA